MISKESVNPQWYKTIQLVTEGFSWNLGVVKIKKELYNEWTLNYEWALLENTSVDDDKIDNYKYINILLTNSHYFYTNILKDLSLDALINNVYYRNII